MLSQVFSFPERGIALVAPSGREFHLCTPSLSVWEAGDLAVLRHFAGYCRVEKDAGRKVLVYLRRDKWVERRRYVAALVQSDLRVACLPQTVPPRRWGTWITETMADGVDVLLVKGEISSVETPNCFSTVVFCGEEWFYHLAWPAVKRVWNAQNRPVKVIFQAAPNWLVGVEQNLR